MSLNVFMKIVRFWVPVAILAGGIVLVIVRGGDETSLEGCAALWGAGLSVALLNWLHRIGVSGDSARAEEDEARAYFARYGRWPDEVPPRQGS
jgi:ribose/xylose/arabinose/galactoside ABC-type transport system permease subunit